MPVTHTDLFDKVVSRENLIAAALELFTGKRRFKPDVLYVATHLLDVVNWLHTELVNGTWTPMPYNRFIAKNDVKRRIVHAPAVFDRIVHHAIMRVVHPLFITKFVHDSYAITPGKGNQRAVRRLQAFLAAATACAHGAPVYAVKADIHKFYPNMNHRVLRRQLARTLRDKRLLDLWWAYITAFAMYMPGVGLPVGAYISQLSANVYLNPLDHFVKDQLGMYWYVRYMDDFVVLSTDIDELFAFIAVVNDFLHTELGLVLNPKTSVFRVVHGMDFVGYRVFADRVRPRRRNVRRARTRFRGIAARWCGTSADHEELRQQVAAFAGNLTPCAALTTFNATRADFRRRAGIDSQ